MPNWVYLFINEIKHRFSSNGIGKSPWSQLSHLCASITVIVRLLPPRICRGHTAPLPRPGSTPPRLAPGTRPYVNRSTADYALIPFLSTKPLSLLCAENVAEARQVARICLDPVMYIVRATTQLYWVIVIRFTKLLSSLPLVPFASSSGPLFSRLFIVQQVIYGQDKIYSITGPGDNISTTGKSR